MTRMAAPDRTYEGRTNTGKPTILAKLKASSAATRAVRQADQSQKHSMRDAHLKITSFFWGGVQKMFSENCKISPDLFPSFPFQLSSNLTNSDHSGWSMPNSSHMAENFDRSSPGKMAGGNDFLFCKRFRFNTSRNVCI